MQLQKEQQREATNKNSMKTCEKTLSNAYFARPNSFHRTFFERQQPSVRAFFNENR